MIATYRLQLTPQFGFAEARTWIPYLRRLGVSHVYLSPITEARQGSTHGYDVVDHNTVRGELGGALQFQLLLAEARQHKLRVILDIVPNHAGLGMQNSRFQDVLTYGPHSPHAHYFDIEWQPLKPELRNKVLLPFLGANYGEVMDDHGIDIAMVSGRLYASYGEGRFALKPSSYGAVLRHILPRLPGGPRGRGELQAHIPALEAWQEPDRARGEDLIRAVHRLVTDAEFIAAWRPMALPDLHALLEQQYWRLANWRVASHEINYRRFFDINDLIGLRMEDPRVFAATHRLIKEMLCDDVVAGLRIDHVDGLYDPHGYLERLRTLGARHVWVEKILAPDERLPREWPVDGTTGYEFGADVTALCVHPHGRVPLTRLYQRYVSDRTPYRDEVYRSKRMMVTTKLAGELQRLAYELDRLSEADFHSRDFTLQALREALAEVVAVFPRYRTYLPHGANTARRVVEAAVQQAASRNRAVDPLVYRFIGKMLLSPAPSTRPAHSAWVARFQQYTAPVTAKGVEDTAFYRYNRLVALNEVGAHPGRFGMPARQFHRHAAERARHYPRNLLATSTHDTKRGEDLRMRIAVYSELPAEWASTVAALHEACRKHRTEGAPSRHDMYLFFQTLVATWDPKDPSLPDRLCAYMEKAVREAKRHSSWTSPNAAYEGALYRFIMGVTADPAVHAAAAPLAAKVAHFGLHNSVTQLVLKCTAPGIPDIYRGCEWLDLSLVDPDNRRPVDFAARDAAVNKLSPLVASPDAAAVRALLESDANSMKLYMTLRLLRLRQEHGEMLETLYKPLKTRGARRGHVIAYMRGTSMVVAPRFFASLQAKGGWQDTRIAVPPLLVNQPLIDYLTGARVTCTETLAPGDLPLPWAVLLPAT